MTKFRCFFFQNPLVDHIGVYSDTNYVLVSGKKDKHMVGIVDTLITRGQYSAMRSNTRILYTRRINNTLIIIALTLFSVVILTKI